VNDTIEGAAENQVARYATAVRAAFADLPGPERELLLEDLEDHLQEVAAEAGGSLAERLGRPEAYAAELRASAGLPAPGASGRRPRPGLRDSAAARRLERLWREARAHPAGGAVVEFLPELRPAWWVARGYLAVQAAAVALTPLFAGGGLSFPVPALFGSRVLGLLATGAAVVASVRLGRQGPGSPRRHALTLLANAALGLFALAMLVELGSSEAADDYYRPEYVTTYSQPLPGLRSDGVEISNLYAFDASGKPLRDVYLVDQDGQPVVASNSEDPGLKPVLPLDREGNEVGHRYPQQQIRVDPTTGQRVPVTAPAFRPPPGPLRPPPDPGPPTTDPPPGP
jgi:hypothetical protein